MTRVYVVAGLICLMCGQTAAAWGQDKPNSLEAGVWALQFAIDKNFTLESFDRGTIAAKHHLSDRTAVRGAVTVNTDNVEVDQETAGRPTDTTRVDLYGVLLSLNLLKYLRPDARWSFFAGFGPIVGFGYRHETNNGTSLDSTIHDWSVGLQAIWGAEWFASRVIGIHAEYGLNGVFSSRTRDETSPGFARSEEIKRLSLGASGVRFGLSAYF